MNRPVVLVTGGTGFVGRNLIPALAAAGFAVRATHRNPLPSSAPAAEWLLIPDRPEVRDWKLPLAGATHVVHLAALAHRMGRGGEVAESEYNVANHVATARLAEAVAAAGGIQRFIFVSSIGAVCPMSDQPVDENTPCRPVTAYGRSKLAAEQAVKRVLASSTSDWCILRPPLVYGPGNPGNLNRLLGLIRRRWPLPFGSIRNRRSLIYVGNLVDAVRVVLECPAASRCTFGLSDGILMSTPDLVRALAAAEGLSPRIFPFPVWALRFTAYAARTASALRGGDGARAADSLEKLCTSLAVDDSLFRRTCGWRPPHAIADGLRSAVRPAS
ncbi:MAG TPA: NAD-dependent epimerase/dehydratase family protein [Candidatus Didemnitutus sp.]|jgi:nucleoside-diphosphate-sugar epimerase